MTNKEFVEKLLDVRKYKTKYAKGTFGQKATPSFINQKAKQYPSWYKNKIDMFLALPDDTRLFDCVGLIKGVIWGFPDMIYTSNHFKDYSDQSLWDACTDKKYDFSNIQIGECLWLKGHVGVYIGDGKAIECTNAWTGNVQITAVRNIGNIAGLNGYKWTGHGKIPTIVYNATEGSNSNEKPKVDYSHYPILKKGSTGQYVKIMQQLLVDKGYDPNGVDGICGNGCLACVKKYQSENTDIDGKKLVVDGCVGQKTWGSLYK